MNVLVLGGTRFFGVHMVNALLNNGHHVTIATRGQTKDVFGQKVERVIIERTSSESIADALGKRYFDVVCDNLAYCSNDVRYLLDNIKCGRCVMTSSASVYTDLHMCTEESEFNPFSYPHKWCSREDYTYNEAKRQAECALFQFYPQFQSAAVRLPFVIGEDDYTQRLYFYVKQIMSDSPISVNSTNAQIAFISSAEAGNFIAWIAEQKFTGAVNGCSIGTISLQEVFDYVEQKTGKKAIISAEGLEEPYSVQQSFSLDTAFASNAGYCFSELKEWIYGLLDKYVDKAYEGLDNRKEI